MAHFNFKSEVTAMAFSPDSKFFFVACQLKCKIFETPSDIKTFSPLVLYKKYGNLHSQTIRGVVWSHDSRFIVTWSDDMTLKMISLHKLPGFLPFTFSGNKRQIKKVIFSQDDRRLFSIAENGTMLMWKWTEERSQESEAVLKFQAFKTGKRLKTGDKNEYKSTQ
jgi:periodic tryptophan protein 2